MASSDIRSWYAAHHHDEWRRLRQDAYHQLEEMVTTHFLHKHLPRRGLILDAGSGPGRYSIALAKAGYDVVLLDLVPDMLALARRKARAARVSQRFQGFIEGSIEDLSQFDAGSFDAVLCLGGPLNHLMGVRQRRRAAAELARVAKPRAHLFVSVISRLAMMRGMLLHFPHLLGHAKDHWESGDYRPGENGEGFTAAHWFLPDELASLFAGVHAEVVELAGLEGLSAHHPRETNQLKREHPRRWRLWQELILATSTNPGVVGSSEHFLLVAQKR